MWKIHSLISSSNVVIFLKKKEINTRRRGKEGRKEEDWKGGKKLCDMKHLVCILSLFLVCYQVNKKKEEKERISEWTRDIKRSTWERIVTKSFIKPPITNMKNFSVAFILVVPAKKNYFYYTRLCLHTQ